MLERTLKTQFVPGTNLRGDVAGANWTYVLPSLELEHIVCIGAPPSATLAALARLGRVSIVAETRALEHLEPLDQWGNVARLDRGADGALALPSESADLALLTGGVRALDPALQGEIARILRPGGLLWSEIGGPRAWLRRSATLDELRDSLGGTALYWLTPLAGEVHTVVPLSHTVALRYFLDRGLYSPTLTLQRLKRARRALPGASSRSESADGGEPADDTEGKSGGLRVRAKRTAFGLLDRAARAEQLIHRSVRAASRHGVLAGALALDDGPPAYLRAIAAERGLDLTDYRWGLWAAGAYSSRKLLFFLFPPGESAPAYLVKMVRDPAFNGRLENEWHALDRLAALGFDDGALPRVPFAGHHAGLAVVAETVIEGKPFREVAGWSAGDPALRAGVEWLTELGRRTATMRATAAAVAEALEQLLAQFRAIYRLDPAQEQFLTERIAAVRVLTTEVPLVFQHGDPGTWNVLVTPRGEAAFLDWESAEPDGMPLWDLFYFLRSYVVSAERASGQHDRLAGFAAHFLNAGGLSDTLVEAVRGYREQVGLDNVTAETLFYTCWLHRALKQATLLPPARVDRDSHYANLLRLGIQRRDSPTLRRIWGT